MFDAIKPLLESGIVNAETAQAINEAWESKLNEARTELRQEFAQKYEHDKNVMVEALDKMVTIGLSKEIEEFNEERRAMNEDRVQAQTTLRENANKFNKFLITKLSEEIKELRADRKIQKESTNKLESFVIKSLAKEIREFEQDKRAVVEAKVKLVAEAKHQLVNLKNKFVSESAKKISAVVNQQLKGEIKQLREDIELAKQNHFGRKLFEAFAAEFSVSHLNEKSETRKLIAKLEEKQEQLAEATKIIKQSQRLVENKEREVKMIKESNLREKILSELLGTLNEEKSTIMKNLLESVQTPKLKAAFDKYLPAVLNTDVKKQSVEKKQVVTESVVTGDKSAMKIEVDAEERDNVIAIKRLAGL